MTAPSAKILRRIRSLLDDIGPGDYWHAIFEANKQLGDPLNELPTKEATARILAAFAIWGSVDVGAAIAKASEPATDDEPPEGWEERAMERWRREAKPPRS